MFRFRGVQVRVLMFAASAGALAIIGLQMLFVTISPTEYITWHESQAIAALETVMLLGLAIFQFREALRRS